MIAQVAGFARGLWGAPVRVAMAPGQAAADFVRGQVASATTPRNVGNRAEEVAEVEIPEAAARAYGAGLAVHRSVKAASRLGLGLVGLGVAVGTAGAIGRAVRR